MPDDAKDQRVVDAIGGDLDAFERLVREASPALREQLRIDGKWSRSFDVDDVLQVTYLESFLRIRSLRTPTMTAFRSWLARIAEHNLINAVRALESARRPDADHRLTRGPAGESARTLLLQVAGDGATAGGRAVVTEQIERMHEAIAQLPQSYRRVIELIDLEQQSFSEAAGTLDRSIGAVHMLRARAHDRLAELMRESP